MAIVNWSLIAGAGLLFLAVLLGAFGAHALADLLAQNQRLPVFDTASRYHFYHGISLIVFGVLIRNFPELWLQKTIFFCLLAGTVIFSGSLYFLAVFNQSWLGAIAPIGGGLLLFAWASLFYSLYFSLDISNIATKTKRKQEEIK